MAGLPQPLDLPIHSQRSLLQQPQPALDSVTPYYPGSAHRWRGSQPELGGFLHSRPSQGLCVRSCGPPFQAVVPLMERTGFATYGGTVFHTIIYAVKSGAPLALVARPFSNLPAPECIQCTQCILSWVKVNMFILGRPRYKFLYRGRSSPANNIM